MVTYRRAIVLPAAIFAMLGCSSGASTETDAAATAKGSPVERQTPADATGSPDEIRYARNADGAVENLPFARGEVFHSLDDYLAHLEKGGAIDLPYWREVSPGVYEHVKRMPGATRETATRAELERRFGFAQ